MWSIGIFYAREGTQFADEYERGRFFVAWGPERCPKVQGSDR